MEQEEKNEKYLAVLPSKGDNFKTYINFEAVREVKRTPDQIYQSRPLAHGN